MELKDRLARRRAALSPEQRAEVAARLRGEAPPDPARRPIPRRRERAPAPLSFAQQRLWFLDQLFPGNPFHGELVAFRVRGPLRPALLAASLRALGARHEALRTSFPVVAGHPVQEVAAAPAVALATADLAALPRGSQEDQITRLSRDLAGRAYDLARGPLLRALLVRRGAEEHVFLLGLHQIVADGWAHGVLLRDLAALYDAAERRRAPALPPLAIQVADFAVWQREQLAGEALAGHLAYWRRQLAGLPPLALPADRPRPETPSFRGGNVSSSLSAALSAAALALGRGAGATPFMTLLAAFQALLCRAGGEAEVAVGAPVANRGRPELAPLVGFFANTLVLRADLSDRPSFRQLLGRVRETVLAAFEHQDLPFERLVQELAPERDLASHPLVSVMLVLYDALPPVRLGAAGLEIETLRPPPGAARFDLALFVEQAGERWTARLDYARDLFSPPTAARLLGQLGALLEGAAAAPQAGVWELPLLGPAERHQLLVEWNDTAPRPGRVLRRVELLIAEQAARTPEAVAVADAAGARLTYAELAAGAARLAGRLAAAGVRAEEPVALCLERSPEMVVAVLGVLAAGAACLPLDPDYPAERLAAMLRQAGARRVVTAGAAAAERLPAGLERFDLAGAAPPLPSSPPPAPSSPPALSPAPPPPAPAGGLDRLALALFTSGSTGAPKAVMITHRGLANRLAWGQRLYPLTPADRVLQSAPLAFDFAAWELLAPLAAGATLVLAAPDGHRDAAGLAALIAAQEVTVAHFVPSMLRAFLDQDLERCRSLRLLFAGGEALDGASRDRLRAACPAAALWNQYGPAEATIDVTCHRCAADERAAAVPLGRPADDTQVVLLGRGGEPAPLGAVGEICLGGAGLARGYLGRPELTAERFVPHPRGRRPGERLYRSGDLGRFRADGVLEFRGRADRQVKVRGVRIEPAEVEACLAAHPAVAEVTVVVRAGPDGADQLVAYLVPRAAPLAGSAAPPLEPELREHARRRLPAALVPARYIALPALPRSAAGKLDRQALPAPRWGDDERGAAGRPPAVPAMPPPADPVAEVLAEIWREVLGVEVPGGEADFFALGGHSLLAVQVVSRVREAFAVELPLADLFAAPTLSGLARRVEERRREGQGLAPPPLLPAPRDGDLPLSFAQQRLWFLDRLEPGNWTYNLPAALRLSGRLAVPALAAALAAVVRRHEVLRTRFAERRGKAVQIVEPARPLGLPLVDLAALPAPRREREAARLAAAEARRPFALASGPPLRGTLLRTAREEHLVLLTVHHIAADAWSMGVLVREMGALYAAGLAGAAAAGAALPPLPVQYADFARWQRDWLTGAALAGQLAYWRRALAGAPAALALPADRSRPAVATQRGALAPVALAGAAVGALRGAARRQGATSFMALLACFQALLHRITGATDVRCGTPVANRGRRELEGLIGCFVNTLVVRGELGGGPSLVTLLPRVREAALGAYAHQDLPFERLVEELAPERSLARTPLFSVLFTLQHREAARLELPGLVLEPFGLASPNAQFELAAVLTDEGGAVRGHLLYNADLFDPPTMARLAGHFANLVAAAAAAPGTPLAELPLLAAHELQQTLRESNDTAADLPRTASLDQLFARQAERTPEAVAACCGAARLRYRELDRRAERLALRLAALGVGPEVPVGICLERSLAALAAVLAVWKAGGVYVPLDPGYPAERLDALVADAGCALVLTSGAVADRLGGGAPAILLEALEVPAAAALAGPTAPAVKVPAQAALAGEHGACLLYTSGSTGRPKGVLVTHGALCHRLLWGQSVHPLGAGDRLLATASWSFDIALWELCAPLLAGACLVLPPAGEPLDFAGLMRWLAAEGITVVHFVPSLLARVLAGGELGPTRLRRVFCGGEALAGELRRRFAERVGAPLVHQYGPTEATITVSVDAGDPGRPERVDLGRPIANHRLYLLDRGLRPVPLGVAGEVCIAGAGLARGYHGRPAATAERFLPDPWADAPGERLYRTGDLGRRLADGRIEFLGRRDSQVKIHGIRIEPGEIEAALARHPAVAAAAVVARDEGAGERRLVAYLVARPAAGLDSGLDIGLDAAVREFLAASLPRHLVPAAFVVLPALPLTPNGKLDRAALPAPERASPAAQVAPRTPAEAALAAIWRAVLGLQAVGVEDNFFAAGGDSIRAIEVVAAAREAGFALTLRQLFEHQTIAALAALAEAAGPDGGARPEARPAAAATGATGAAGPAGPAAAAERSYTPTDFPRARLSQRELDALVARLGGRAEAGER